MAERGLAARLAGLREAVEAAEGRLEVPEVGRARALLAKAGARQALGEATVVALAGATGSGKSTLFNALSGAQVSTPGVRRPTTGTAHATVWGEPQDALLDWLQVPRRHLHDPAGTPEDAALDGLVLLDLPDHDSVRLENRLEVDRLVELVDVLVWVLDPEKYADAAVHHRYLRPLAGHAGTLLVVLNQADRLPAPDLAACRADLRRLLDDEALAGTELLTVSARTGAGLPQLTRLLVDRVAARRAATERLTADVRAAARDLQAHAGTTADRRASRVDDGDLTRALAGAAGVPVVVAAVQRSTLRAGTAATGWPVVRWLGKLRPDPLRRLHLGVGGAGGTARSSLPATGAVERAGVATAVRRARDAAGADLPLSWADDLRRTAEVHDDRLADRLDQAVSGTDLGSDRTPAWQRGVGVLQWAVTAAALVGALWLLGLVVLGWLQVADLVPLPRVQGIPLPTLLLVGGLLAGLLLAVLARPFVVVRARRRARTARRRLERAVAEVARAEVLDPLAATTADHRRFATALARAAG